MSLAYQIGDSLPRLERGPIQADMLTRYAQISGDFNPIHLDEKAANAAGLNGVIAHGMLSMAYAGSMLTQAFGDAGELVDFTVRFRGMVHLGDLVTCEGTVTNIVASDDGKIATIAVSVKTNHQDIAIKGTANVRLKEDVAR
ncbi:MaoC/PaaZ C-terminal domain-containing protein [Ferroacidibacillus organovorans]|uniref:MaoC-like domain-containing protein n=1 Tax=Ferroacidibacillus organovorans TaxID=1765683 RepID=A0A101XRP4_9BACL|nr:MaoC/PaaZ C-terminal domain-containing protein [Ferroacidibacillus organovorans]KUO96302.1 hypothetical protein ATW55_03585 [Ferroacidibacillus organovorans]